MIKGTKHSEEAKTKMSRARKGKNNPMFGRPGFYKGKTLSEEHKRKISLSMVGKKPSEETKKKMSEAGKGRIFPEEHRRRISEAKRGKKHSKETKERMSRSKRGGKNPNWEKSPPEETRKKMSLARWKEKVIIICQTCNKEFKVMPHRLGKTKFCSRRCRAIWVMQHMGKKNTSIELAIRAELDRQGISYLQQSPVEGIALVDFLLPNKIILQCDGEYWHNLPRQKGRDVNQDFLLGSMGYRVFRFTGAEIKQSPAECLSRLKCFL